MQEVREAPPDEQTARGDRRTLERRSRRRFVCGSAVGIAVSSTVFAWLVTGGTWQFLRSLPYSNFYDVQARSFLHGTWSMPAATLSIEGIRTAGRTDMYFGPVPALLRLPVLIFTHRLDGRLTELSLLVAFVLALVFASLLSWRLRTMVRGPAVVTRLEAALTAGLVLVIGVGSVLFFLGSAAQVYEEAEMWGATLALGAFWALAGFVDRPSPGRLVASALLAVLAVLTRGSVGAGPTVALGLVAAVYVFAWVSARIPRWRSTARRTSRLAGVQVADSPGRFAVGLVAAAVLPVVLYVVVNEIKFDTPFSIPLNHQVATGEFAHRRAVLAANGGSLFGLKFLPTNLLQYVRPDALSVSRLFPWVFFPGKALVLGHVLFTTRDWTSSVPASMPLLAILAVVGVIAVYRPVRRRHRNSDATTSEDGADAATAAPVPGAGVGVLRLLLVGAAAGTAGILAISFLAERYLADVVPLLLLATVAGWHVLLSWRSGAAVPRGALRPPRAAHTAVTVLLVVVLVAVALFQLWTSVSLSLFYQRELAPVVTIPQRAGMVALQQRIRKELGDGPTPGVHYVSSLPPRAAPLDLAVVGDCAGVYQFDGNAWQPVEIGAGGGGFLLQVTFPRTERGRRQPLLVSNASHPQDVVALTWEGDDLYRLSYVFDSSVFGSPRPGWYTGPAFTVSADRPHRVQVDLVSGLAQIYVTVDGSPELSLLYPVTPPDHVRFGSAPTSVSTTAAFAGRIRQLPVPTPICDQLERQR